MVRFHPVSSAISGTRIPEPPKKVLEFLESTVFNQDELEGFFLWLNSLIRRSTSQDSSTKCENMFLDQLPESVAHRIRIHNLNGYSFKGISSHDLARTLSDLLPLNSVSQRLKYGLLEAGRLNRNLFETSSALEGVGIVTLKDFLESTPSQIASAKGIGLSRFSLLLKVLRISYRLEIRSRYKKENEAATVESLVALDIPFRDLLKGKLSSSGYTI